MTVCSIFVLDAPIAPQPGPGLIAGVGVLHGDVSLQALTKVLSF
jgi:hypothetical protein